jgi:hypothetical protein
LVRLDRLKHPWLLHFRDTAMEIKYQVHTILSKSSIRHNASFGNKLLLSEKQV